MLPHFIGNTAYCYANSLAMAMASRGETVHPGLIEALTLVGLGAAWEPAPDGPVLFFSGAGLNPDTGLDHAITALGWQCTAHFTSMVEMDETISLARLRAMLAEGPVVAGPLEMSELLYLPHHANLTGVDHFVLVHAIADNRVLIHDPAGYPAVSLSIDQFVRAWRGETVWYRRGNFGLWGNFQRIDTPDAKALANRVIASIAVCLNQAPPSLPDAARDGDAIRELAALARTGELGGSLRNHLIWFALPLGARRALDLAELIAVAGDPRAKTKRDQASAFGSAHTALVANDHTATATALDRVAALDDAFTSVIRERTNLAPVTR